MTNLSPMDPAPMTTEDPPRQHWTFDTRVNVAHLLTSVTLAIGLIGFVVANDRRVTLLEAAAATQKERDVMQDSATAAAVLLLRGDLIDLRGEVRETNRKIERYLERQPQPRER